MADKILTQEQINELPLIAYKVGNIDIEGRYDEDTNLFFFIDADGVPTGRSIPLAFKPSAESVIAPASSAKEQETEEVSDSLSDKEKNGKLFLLVKRFRNRREQRIKDSKPVGYAVKKEPEQKEERESDKRKRSFPSFKRIALYTVGSVVFAFSVAAITWRFVVPFLGLADGSSDALADAYYSAKNQIAVVEVTSDLLPGDVITEEDIVRSPVSAEVYNDITLAQQASIGAGAGLYKWDDAESLIGLHVARYIPEGQYLTYYAVVDEYNGAVNNPFMDAKDGTSIVPVKLPKDVLSNELLNFGSKINVTITKHTDKSDDVKDGSETLNGGATHTIKVEDNDVVHTYTFSTAIADMLDTHQESLYPLYASWKDLPIGEQIGYIEEEFQLQPQLRFELQPHYVSVRIPSDVAEVVGDMTKSKVDVKITFPGGYDNDGETKKLVCEQMRLLKLSIDKVNSGGESSEQSE